MEESLPRAQLTEEDLTLFYEVANSIHAIRDLDEMLQNILQKIKQVFRVDGASLALHDAERSEFYFIRTVEEAQNGDHERKKKMRFPDHLGVAGWVLRERKAAVIPDVSKDDRFFKGIDLQQDYETRSMICLPLLSRRGFIGILYVLNKLEGEFTTRDAKLLETLSGTIAIAWRTPGSTGNSNSTRSLSSRRISDSSPKCNRDSTCTELWAPVLP